MFALSIVLAWAVVGYQNQGDIPKADVVLVIERASGERYVYTCNGRPLDPARVATGVDPFLRKTDTGATPMFVLFGEGVPLDKVFEIGALFEGKAGLTNVRYFAFSRKTGVMLEVKPSWDRWKVAFDGRLERIPWLEKKNP
jgi:hypothetical protein